jgi:hypothetical protein
MPIRFWPAALFALVLGACAAPAPAADDTGAGWITDYGKAKAVARASGKPIFLVFRCER